MKLAHDDYSYFYLVHHMSMGLILPWMMLRAIPIGFQAAGGFANARVSKEYVVPSTLFRVDVSDLDQVPEKLKEMIKCQLDC